MQKALKWLLPLVLVIEGALVWSKVLDLGTAAVVVGVLELLGLLLGLRAIIAAVRQYRSDRAAGLDLTAALEEGLTVIFPRKIARLIALEPQIYVCLYQFARRRRRTADEFAYHGRSALGSVVALILLTAPFEILAYELLIPWAGVRWALLLLTIYSVIWLLGLYASFRTLPYQLTAEGLRLHYGILAEGTVPYRALADVTLERRKAPGGHEGLQTSRDGALYLAVGGRTDLTLRLHTPVIIHGLFQSQPPATILHLTADDPTALLTALRARAGLPVTAPPVPARAGVAGRWPVAQEA